LVARCFNLKILEEDLLQLSLNAKAH